MPPRSRFARAAATAGAALGLSLTCGSYILSAANWPGWRGPEGQGVSVESNLPTEWSSSQNVAWKVPVGGRGHSSPIVWENRVFLTSAAEGEASGGKAPVHQLGGKDFLHPDSVGVDKRHTYKVMAYDLNNGTLLWEKTAYDGPVYDNRHKKGSYASPTPVTDGKRVYAYFGSEGIYAYDAKDGKLAWKTDIGDIATIGMGTASSPVLYKNLVILQCDDSGTNKSFLVALDAKNGKEAWRTQRDVSVSWATPVLVKAGARDELVTSATEWIIGYDPATGKELWRTKGVESNAIHTPLVGHGLVIATAGYPEKRVIAIRPGGSGDVTGTDRIAWTFNKGTAYVASPILYGDYLYLLADNGVVTCLDAKTGQVKYEGGRPPKPGRFTSSPVAYDGKILLTSEPGDSFVLKAGPVHEILRTNSLGEEVMATPAISQGRILIRTLSHLYCIKTGAPAASPAE